MRAQGRFWHSGNSAEDALSHGQMMKGPGYRVTLVRTKPDRFGVLALLSWEIEDQDKVDEEHRRTLGEPFGHQVQAMSYLSDHDR